MNETSKKVVQRKAFMAEEKKKNWFVRHKVLTAIIVVFVIIGIAGAGGSDSSTGTSGKSDDAMVKEETMVDDSMTYEEVSTSEMIAAFDDNQLAAEKTYKGKGVQLTARIKNISEDITGTPFLSLEPSDAEEYYFGTTVQCMFENSDDLLSVSNDSLVTVKGVVDEQSLGIILVEDCMIVE